MASDMVLRQPERLGPRYSILLCPVDAVDFDDCLIPLSAVRGDRTCLGSSCASFGSRALTVEDSQTLGNDVDSNIQRMPLRAKA